MVDLRTPRLHTSRQSSTIYHRSIPVWRQMEVSMPVPVGTMFIRLRSFSKCVPAPRPCALYRRKETRSSGHTRKRMRNTLSRRRTEAHRASPEERDGVFPHIPPSTTRALPSDKKKYREVHTHMHRNFLFITQKFFVFRCLRFVFFVAFAFAFASSTFSSCRLWSYTTLLPLSADKCSWLLS